MSVERTVTLGCLLDVVDDITGIEISRLPPSTTLLVQTRNTLYRIVIAEGTEVTVQGGVFFPDPVSAHVAGATFWGTCLKADWIGIGLPVEIRSGGRRIVTSRVRAIATE